MQLVTSFCRHTCLLPCHQGSSQVTCIINLLSKLQCSQRSYMVIMINGLRVLFRLIDLNALVPFIVNKLYANHHNVRKHESCRSEWQSS